MHQPNKANLARRNIKDNRFRFSHVLLFVGLCLGTSTVLAQPETSGTNDGSDLAIKQIQQQLETVAADEALSSGLKLNLGAIYREALQNLLSRADAQSQEAAARTLLTTGPDTLKNLESRLEAGSDLQLLQDQDLLDAINSDLVPPQQGLIKLENRLKTINSGLNELNRSLRSVQDLPSDLSAQLAEARLRSRELGTSDLPSEDNNLDPRFRAARATLRQTERIMLTAQISMLEQQLLALDTRGSLLRARKRLADAQAETLRSHAVALQLLVNEERRQEADAVQQELTQIQILLPDMDEQARQWAKTNAQLVEDIDQYEQHRRNISNRTLTLNALQLQVESSLDNVNQILAVRTSGAEVGHLLSNEYNQIPEQKTLLQDLEQLQKLGIAARLERLKLQNQQRQNENKDAVVEKIRSQVKTPSLAQFDTLREAITERRKELIESALATLESYLSATESLEIGYTRLIAQVEQLSNLLEERLFWVRSAPPIGAGWWRDLGAGVIWLLQPGPWNSAFKALTNGIKSTPLFSGLMVLVVALLLGNVSRMRAINRRNASYVGQYNDRFRYTLYSLFITLIRALPVPLLFLWLGSIIYSQANTPTDFVANVGFALISCSLIFYVFAVARRMCRAEGMMRRHFGWRGQAQKILYRNLVWLNVVIITAAFLVALTYSSDQPVLVNGLGRFSFLMASLALSFFAYRVLAPNDGAIGHLLNHDGRLWQLRWVWYGLAVGMPLALFVLAAVGFYFTASEIQERLFTSGWLIFASSIFYGLALRWLLVTNRKLAYSRALEDQKRRTRQQQARQANEATGDARPETLEVASIGVDSINTQTLRIIRLFIGVATVFLLWSVWDGVVPALNFLDDFKLWNRPYVAGQDESLAFVSLADLIYCLISVAITAAAARNLPGLVEIFFLSRMSVDAGTRYAVSTIARYVIVAVGFLVAVAFLGVDWSKLQWIVAALGVGLGFGLQEIVANFVSGLIILFERPVRVGDTVTVGGVDGTVSRLQIRATTITDWDNREILVPNKNFITDQVTNWTLTTSVNRLVVPVGIAYGSDTAKAQQVMLEAVKTIPFIMEEPMPTVFFLGFGDSSLNFVVRAFVGTLENRLHGLHEIHSVVEKALRENGFAIPFPQRDVHLFQTSPDAGDQQ